MYLLFLLLNWLCIKRNKETYESHLPIMVLVLFYSHSTPIYIDHNARLASSLHLSDKWNNLCYLVCLFSLTCTLRISCERILHRKWVALGRKQYCIFIRIPLNPRMEPPYRQTLCNGPAPWDHRQQAKAQQCIFVKINWSATRILLEKQFLQTGKGPLLEKNIFLGGGKDLC